MTFLMAGGGTGGHVFPLIAVADALRVLAPEYPVAFVGTARGLEATLVPERGYPLELLDVAPIRGGGLRGVLRGVSRAGMVLPAALKVIEKWRPRAVFSVGGYAAGPVAVAARIVGVPLALLEPNAVVGLANALTAPIVQRAYTAFSEAEAVFPPTRVVRRGVPIRDGFRPCDYRLEHGPRRILVLGGSQGAKALNEAVPAALSRMKVNLRIVHQCGAKHVEATRHNYEQHGNDHRVDVVPFIDDMPRALEEAELVVSRAGASAVSEVCAVGRPSILVPYPFAAGDHQRRNAEALERLGACRCVRAQEASPERLAEEFAGLLGNERVLCSMARAAREFGKPSAARAIARDLIGFTAEAATPPKSNGALGVSPSPCHGLSCEGVR